MNCPNCGKRMEQGKVITSYSRGLFFLPPDGDIDAFFLTKKYVTKQDGIVLDGPYNTNLHNESLFSACVCRDCRKVILDY